MLKEHLDTLRTQLDRLPNTDVWIRATADNDGEAVELNSEVTRISYDPVLDKIIVELDVWHG